MRRFALAMSLGLSMAGGASALAASAEDAPAVAETPIVIGRSYALPSAVMGQTREINVWLPPRYAESGQTYPVLYVLEAVRIRTSTTSRASPSWGPSSARRAM